MPNKMLIDATHLEETRVVVVRGNRVEEFDFETAQRKQLRGNIYLAKVTRVEPSLQAAFIEYGGNRHGFLAFSEIHPDYYQIPVADRQALIEADERAHREAEEESENRSSRRRPRHRNSRRRSNGDRVRSDVVDATALDPSQAPQPYDDAAGAHDAAGEVQAPPHDADADHAEPHADDGEHTTHARPDADDIGAQEPVAHHEAEHAPTDDHPHAEPAVSEPQVGTAFDPATAVGAAVPHDADATEAASHTDDQHITSDADEHAHDEHAHDEHADVEHHPHADDDADEDDEEEAEEDQVESVGGDDALEEVPERAFRPRRQYKIQEVIKRRQVMLVQVVKEERGNKGAALTTYLSLAGRYAVLMPNTARGGGISRKITSAQDRSRLKEVVQDLDVPEGMGIILRTAGAARTKPEIKRDFEYLIRMWETVRDLTLKSQAPTLVYEEGSLIKRSLRDLFNKEIDEIQVAGEAGYQEARDFMHMLMPTSVRAVKLYRDGQPLFSRMGVESQLDAMFSPTVQLRSGGYIVLNQTEALVSIDVNSGRSTREHHIEDTALKTNLEAAEEVARQLRLRDLAGLIVIDFIDMEEKRNNRAVERKLSDCLRQDRARIQIGRISHFGLMEMSRQRIRASVLESSTEPCPHCGGSGHVRSVSSVALQLLRGLEEVLMKGATHNLVVRTRTDVALYVLNHKRGHLRNLEDGFKVTLAVIADATVSGQQSFVIDRGEQVHTLETAKALLASQVAASPPQIDEPFDDEEPFEADAEVETEETIGLVEEIPSDEEAGRETDGESRPRGKRRRRRRGRPGDAREDHAPFNAAATDAEAAETVGNDESDDGEDETSDGADAPREQTADGERRPRRRGRRGGRRRRGGPENGAEFETPAFGRDSESPADGMMPKADATVGEAEPLQAQPLQAEPLRIEPSQFEPVQAEPLQVETQPMPAAVAGAESATAAEAEKAAARRRSTVREKVSFGTPPAIVAPAEPVAAASADTTSQASETALEQPSEAAPETAAGEQPRREGWWSRRFGGG